MKVGIGLPLDDPGALPDWARRVDDGPFSSLGIGDRVVYDNPDPLIGLAAAAGVTRRVELRTSVLLAPLRGTTVLAKQLATLDRIAGGRLSVGLGVGPRPDDFTAVSRSYRTRGRRLDEQLERLRAIWSGGDIGPAPARERGPALLFGGFSPRALARVARWGDGFISVSDPELSGQLFRAVEKSWQAAGRPGAPRLVAQINVVLGPEERVERARSAIAAYYRSLGPYAEKVLADLVSTPQGLRETVERYDGLGADEVVCYCWTSDADQLDRIAGVVG